jgi:RimJ/RimL family protein N-acetyltransferase
MLFNMFEMKMSYRRATRSDCSLIYEWANDRTVRENSFTSDSIEYEAHVKWFEEKLNSATSRIYIAYLNARPIGQIRIEIENRNGIINYSVDSQWRGFGYGTLMLKEISAVLERDGVTNIDRVVGKVKYTNIPSQRAFIKAGYLETDVGDYKEYSKEIE